MPQRGGPRARGMFRLKRTGDLRLHASACDCAGARHRARALIVYKIYPLKSPAKRSILVPRDDLWRLATVSSLHKSSRGTKLLLFAGLFNGYILYTMSARARWRAPAQSQALACRRRSSARFRRNIPRARGPPRWGARACSGYFPCLLIRWPFASPLLLEPTLIFQVVQ